MSSDVGWHIRDKLWPMPKHGSIIISLRPRKPEGSLGRTAQDGHLDSHTAPELWTVKWCIYIHIYTVCPLKGTSRAIHLYHPLAVTYYVLTSFRLVLGCVTTHRHQQQHQEYIELLLWDNVIMGDHWAIYRVTGVYLQSQSSGAVWKSRWPCWAFRPNEPYGFRGRKAILNHAHALVSACP